MIVGAGPCHLEDVWGCNTPQKSKKGGPNVRKNFCFPKKNLGGPWNGRGPKFWNTPPNWKPVGTALRGRVTMVHGWTSSLISKIWLFARSGISKISIFKSIIWKITFHTMSFEAIFVWRNEKNWFSMGIVKYSASLLWMFNAYGFCCF
jgi:hypothetical protein